MIFEWRGEMKKLLLIFAALILFTSQAWCTPITYNGAGYILGGNVKWPAGESSENKVTLYRITYGSVVELESYTTQHHCITPSGSTLRVPDGAVGVVIDYDTIAGTLDLDETVTVRYTAVTGTVDLAGIGAGEVATFTGCYFSESQATIEATCPIGASGVTFNSCTFSVDNFNLNGYTPKEVSVLVGAGVDLGYTSDHTGNFIPQGIYPDVGAIEFLYQKHFKGDHETLHSDTTTAHLDPFADPDDYEYVRLDDDTYASTTATNEYAIYIWKSKNENNTDSIKVTYKGKSSLATSFQPAYLQIYNQNTSAWEQLDRDNSTAAGTEFTLSGTIVANVGNYYDANNWVTCRVYQHW